MQSQQSTHTKSADPIAVAQELAAKASEYRHQMRATGRNIPLVQAISHCATQMGLDADDNGSNDPKKAGFRLADKARAYQAEQAKLGITISNVEAVMHVSETESK